MGNDERPFIRHLSPRRKQRNATTVRGGGGVVLWLMLAFNASLAGVLLRRVRYDADDAYLPRGAVAADVNDNVQPCDDGGGDPFALARRQSFGFFDDVTAAHWTRWREIYLDHENHRHPDKPLSYNPDATEGEVRPEIYAQRNSEWSYGWNSYAAWYQNVSARPMRCGGSMFRSSGTTRRLALARRLTLSRSPRAKNDRHRTTSPIFPARSRRGSGCP